MNNVWVKYKLFLVASVIMSRDLLIYIYIAELQPYLLPAGIYKVYHGISFVQLTILGNISMRVHMSKPFRMFL